jgi:hypothetical protein
VGIRISLVCDGRRCDETRGFWIKRSLRLEIDEALKEKSWTTRPHEGTIHAYCPGCSALLSRRRSG